ncbi:hypothetical protein NHJ13051_009873 [Beauveria bassiana]
MAPAETIVRKTMRAKWAAYWETAKHERGLFEPGKPALGLHRGMRRTISFVITQFRSGKNGLGAYLHAINKADSDKASAAMDLKPYDTC